MANIVLVQEPALVALEITDSTAAATALVDAVTACLGVPSCA